MQFWQIIRADLQAMGVEKPSFLGGVSMFFLSPRFLAVFLFRCSSYFSGKNIFSKFLRRFFWRLNCFLTSCDIHIEARIGEGLNLPHPCGVVIGRATIGKNVTILQHVTLGSADFSKLGKDYDEMPKIGDKVTIYAGAVVIGGVNIGNGAQIGANAVVNISVPDGGIAVGIPAKIIQRK